MHKIPVTIITGFLGAGKTTLVRHLLQNSQGRRIAVLVNEFGEVGIDADLLRSCQICDEEPDGSVGDASAPNILELANGCLCCTVQEEFLPTMQVLMERREQLDCIVIETSGLALPKPLVQAFRWPEIRTGATVDGVITVVDCAAIAAGQVATDLAALEAQRQADEQLEHKTPLEELFADQLTCADLVLLTKTDAVDTETRDRTIAHLRDRLPASVKVVPCDRGQIAPELLLGFNAAVEDHLGDRPSRHSHDTNNHDANNHDPDHEHHDHEHHDHDHHDHDHEHHDHDHDHEITSICVSIADPIDPDRLLNRLQALTSEQEIYRIKGFVQVPGKAMRLVLQGVGQRFETFYDRPWRADELRQTTLVAIGRSLEEQDLRSAMIGAIDGARVNF